jgi:hypothetical protein
MRRRVHQGAAHGCPLGARAAGGSARQDHGADERGLGPWSDEEIHLRCMPEKTTIGLGVPAVVRAGAGDVWIPFQRRSLTEPISPGTSQGRGRHA